MPKGGARVGAGRKPNQTAHLIEEARSLASPYAKKALRRAAELAGLVKDVDAAPEKSVQVQCIAIILDRAYGRPKQPVEGEMLHGMSEELRKFIAASATNDRSFIGFDQEDQQPEETPNDGPVSHH